MKIETEMVVTKVYKNDLGELLNRVVSKTSRTEISISETYKEIETSETISLYNQNDKLISQTSESTYVDTDSFQLDKAQMYNEFDEDSIED